MNQNWKQFGMNSALLLEVDMSKNEMTNREHCKRLLTGAVFEYLDEERVEEFICDLSEILVKESEQLLKKASIFQACAKLIEKGLEAMADETMGSEE